MPLRINRWRETPFPSEKLHDLCNRVFSSAGIAKPPGWRPADWAAIEARPLAGQEVLVAHAKETVLGVSVTAVSDQICDLMLIAVDPDVGRAGIGSALLSAGAKHARPRGAVKMMLEVSSRNERAIAFYVGAGFTQTGRRKGYFGQGHDAIVMTRPID
jgi:ribosomal-protein-alanine N-acetyltransferase